MALVRFFFAAVDDELATYDPGVHARNDIDVFSFEIAQHEREYPKADLEIRNPGGGILAQSNLNRIIISWRKSDGSYEVLFRGQVAGFPSDIGGPTVSVRYIGKPDDAESRIQSAHQNIRATKYWNGMFVSDGSWDDPSESLDAHSAELHWKRHDLTVSPSDVLEGGRTIDIGENWVAEGNPVRLVDPPISEVEVKANVSWTQKALGIVSLEQKLAEAMGGPTGTVSGGAGVDTYTPRSLLNALPQQGQSLGPGWSVLSSNAYDQGRSRSSGPWVVSFDKSRETHTPTYNTSTGQCESAQSEQAVQPGNAEIVRKRNKKTIHARRIVLDEVNLEGRLEQKRVERARVRMSNGVQPMFGSGTVRETVDIGTIRDPTEPLFDPPDREVPLWNVDKAANDQYEVGDVVTWAYRFFECVSTPVTDENPASAIDGNPFEPNSGGGSSGGWEEITPRPIGQYTYHGDFLDRAENGKKVFDHLIDIAMDRLRRSARCIEISGSAPLEALSDITLDDSISLADSTPRPAIPGGAATGKVIDYAIRVTGQGEARVDFTIGVAPGQGGSLPSGDRTTAHGFGWSIPSSWPTPDVKVDPTMIGDPSYAVAKVTGSGGADAQESAIQDQCYDESTTGIPDNLNDAKRAPDPSEIARQNRTTFELQMIDLRPEGQLSRTLELTGLTCPLPKQIDLSAT